MKLGTKWARGVFIDPIILYIKTLLPTQEFNALFSFIDDIALQTKSPRTLHKNLHVLFTEEPLYSLSFNATKFSASCSQQRPPCDHSHLLFHTLQHFR